MKKLQIVGGGKMGEALLSGLVDAGWAPSDDLVVVETYAPRATELRDRHAIEVADRPVEAAGTVIAVKPGDVTAAAAGAVEVGTERILSIAAGVTLATLEEVTGTVPVVRAMPNTPALVGRGAAAIAGGNHATDDDLDWAGSILGAVGIVERVPEALLDAVTGLSGSGPAYVFLVAEALIDGGVLNGLPRPTAVALAHQTLLGAATLLTDSGDDAATLRAAVTSPGGTTAAGLRELESQGVRAAILAAVTAATERSRKLGA